MGKIQNTPARKLWNKNYHKKIVVRRKYWLNRFKEKQGCLDCKNKYPCYVLDFDHRDVFNKKFGICTSNGIKSNLKVLIQEVRKCDVVCSNCHRIRTHNNKENILKKVWNDNKI